MIGNNEHVQVPAVPPPDQLPPTLGRFDIVLTHEVVGGFDCWIDGDQIFSNEAHGGWAEVEPGQHEISCEGAWRGGFGKVTQTHHIEPGQNVVLYYSAPWTLFSKGALATTPQRRRLAVDWRYTVTALTMTVLLMAAMFIFFTFFES